MKLETENVQESEASAELIRELMADDARRGNWLILMHDDDEEAFMQIAFDDHPDGIDLEYRDGADKPLYRCKRPVLRLEAENALLDYLDGIETWKHRFEWEVKEGFGGAGGSGGRSFFKKFSLFVVVLVVIAAVIYVSSGKLPRSVSNVVAMVIVLLILGFQFYNVIKSKPQKKLEELGDDDGGIDWRETGAKDVVVETRNGWAVLIENCPVEEAASVATRLETAGMRVRLEVLQVQKIYHLWSIHRATRMCVLVALGDFERAKKVAL